MLSFLTQLRPCRQSRKVDCRVGRATHSPPRNDASGKDSFLTPQAISPSPVILGQAPLDPRIQEKESL
jgi:hypothetical protein